MSMGFVGTGLHLYGWCFEFRIFFLRKFCHQLIVTQCSCVFLVLCINVSTLWIRVPWGEMIVLSVACLGAVTELRLLP